MSSDCSRASLPIVEPLADSLTAEDAFMRLSRLPHCLFLDSALRDPVLGRYSFVTADPFAFTTSQLADADPFSVLRMWLERYATEPLADLPPFQGGAAGVFAYSLGRHFERLPAARIDEFRLPDLAVGAYDVVLAFDHQRRGGWLISQGFPATEPAQRRVRAAERASQFQRWLAGRDLPDEPLSLQPRSSSSDRSQVVSEPLPWSTLAASHRMAGTSELFSNFSANDYRDAIRRAVDYIHAGDIFQVNLSQRLLARPTSDIVSLYRRLRSRNPATFAAYFDAGEFQIASASPERFAKVVQRQIETRPIKGTRQRIGNTEADLFLGDVLLESEKDRSENVMIVDLLRNDLSRICTPESVEVTQLCGLEAYQYVQHLVSAVCGKLKADASTLDLFPAMFPGGSITGAPKIRAMEIIAELEPTARGAYCGCLGYLGFDGAVDLSILIRTLTASKGWWQFPVGGGIVSQSQPEREYEETWHKAAGMLRALPP